MPDKDCVITIITYFLFKNCKGNSTYNDLMSINYHKAG